MPHIKMSLLTAFFFLSLFSCTTENPEKEAIRRLIGMYNRAIVAAYGELNLAPLESVAGEAHVKKVDTIINSYMESDQVMEADLLGLGFKDIKIESDRATVRTFEDWQYQWVNVKTGEIIEPMKDIHYEMIYHLVRNEGKWLVESLQEVEESFVEGQRVSDK
jgi:hypothetical protein